MRDYCKTSEIKHIKLIIVTNVQPLTIITNWDVIQQRGKLKWDTKLWGTVQQSIV